MIAPIMALITPAAAAPDHDQSNIDTERAAPLQQFDYRVYVLLLRYLVVNVVAAGLLGAAYMQGWVDAVLVADRTRLVVLIALLFAIGLAICTQRVWRVSWELNQARSLRPHPASRAAHYLAAVASRSADSRALAAGAMRAKLGARVAIVRHIASTLVLLGLIGTVIGFIMALSGVRPDLATEVEAVAPMISSLIMGMSVALYTTLVGAVLNIWLMVNYRILATGTINLLTTIVERGEAYAGR